MPITRKEWFKRASRPILPDDNHQVVLLLDLDESIISTTPKLSYKRTLTAPSNQAHYSQKLYVDEAALQKVKALQDNGHKVKLLTSNTYSFDQIKEIFSQAEITITPDDYFNQNDITKYGSKRSFVDEIFDNKAAMLFSHSLRDEPRKNVLFTQTFSHHDFPQLIHLDKNTLFLIQEAGVSYDDAWLSIEESLNIRENLPTMFFNTRNNDAPKHAAKEQKEPDCN